MLTPSAVQNAKRRAALYKLTDERGMYLLVKPDDARWWRFDYRRPGTSKRNTISLGVYPDISLRQARVRRDEARELIAQGVDLGEKRKAEAAASADSFEAAAREWIAKRSPKWAPTRADKIVRRLERDVFPWIGAKPVAKITAPEVLAVLRRIESRGAVETVYRARTNCGQVLRYAVATGRADSDVSRDLHGALTAATPKHYAAIVEPERAGELLRAIDEFCGSFVTKSARTSHLRSRTSRLKPKNRYALTPLPRRSSQSQKNALYKTDANRIAALNAQREIIFAERNGNISWAELLEESKRRVEASMSQ